MQQVQQKTTMRFDTGRAVLWASAFVLAALVIMQAGRLPGNPAFAQTTSSRETYTLLTADSGRGDDANPDEILCLIDNQAEVMIIYEIDVRNGSIVPLDGGSLARYFRSALQR